MRRLAQELDENLHPPPGAAARTQAIGYTIRDKIHPIAFSRRVLWDHIRSPPGSSSRTQAIGYTIRDQIHPIAFSRRVLWDPIRPTVAAGTLCCGHCSLWLVLSFSVLPRVHLLCL